MRIALAGWSIVGQAAEDVVLIVSELATNVVEHARTPMLLTLGHVEDRVRVGCATTAPIRRCCAPSRTT